VVFIVAVCTDFIDGAMARTRNQITPLGTLIDPIADKLLVGAVLAWIGYNYLVVQIILTFIVFELVMTAVGASLAARTRQVRAANAFGKSKMVVQSLALVVFLFSGILNWKSWITVSLYMLWVALALAVLSGGKQVLDVLRGKSREQPRNASDTP